MAKSDRQIILASGSPRRKQILEMMGILFEIIMPESIDENKYLDKNDLQRSIQRLALIKAEEIAKRYPGALVLGADTMVVKDHTSYWQTNKSRRCICDIKFFSNSSHTVMTGVALRCIDENYSRTAVNCTDVYFRNISDNEINQYLSIDEYKDKAGSYAIQGRGMIFIEKISGCYYNVVGLPVTSTINLFNDFIARKESADV